MLVKIDDDVVLPYSEWAQANKQPFDAVLARQLARYSGIPLTARVLVLSGAALEAVEKLLGGGQLTTPDAAVKRVREYAQITLGKVDLDLSPAEKSEIVHRAQKQGKTPGQVVKELAAQLRDGLFYDTVPLR